MQEQKFDRLFRERLATHRKAPPPGMWEKITAGASVAPATIPRQSLGFSIAGMALVASLIFFSEFTTVESFPEIREDLTTSEHASLPAEELTAPELQYPQEGIKAQEIARTENNTGNSITKTRNDRDFDELASTQSGEIPETTDPEHIEGLENVPVLPLTESEESYGTGEPVPAEAMVTGDPELTVTDRPGEASGSIHEATHETAGGENAIPLTETSEAGSPGAESLPDEEGAKSPAPVPVAANRASGPVPPILGYIGLNYSPHRITHPGETLDPIGDYRSGFHFGLEYRSLLFETGLQLSTQNSNWKYGVNYLQNDSIDWYWDVVAVSFSPLVNQFGDTVGYEPQYQAVQEAIYDSVAYSHTEDIGMKYTYLHLPFLVGIHRDVPGVKGLSYMLKGGFIYNHAIAVQEPGPAFSKPDVSVTDISDERLFRGHTFLQWTVMAQIHYRLTSNWSVFLEPGLRYYRSAYLRNSLTGVALSKPYSAGIKVGASYHFNISQR